MRKKEEGGCHLKGKKKILLVGLVLLTALAVVSWLPGSLHRGLAQDRSLYWGSYGADVGLVQRRLAAWGYYDGPMDDYYGAPTWVAVQDFQRKNGLRADGVVGPETWTALGYSPAPRAMAAVSYEPAGGVSPSDEAGLLARVVAGEALAEPYLGKVAVAAVILNRVKSPSFPNSLGGVIYQPAAFESVSNGFIWRVADLSESLRAARDALNGWDPSYGSIYFWNPAKPVNPWIWSRQIVTQIGGHVFAR